MKFLIFFSLSFSVLFTRLPAKACQPSKDSCDYYLCKEQEFPCGPRGYPMHFGFRLCQRYLDAELQVSPALQFWFHQVRECLQQAVADIEARSCQELKEKAFDSHVGCYEQTGFCDLSFRDQAEVIRLTSWDVLEPRTAETALKIQAICLAR